MAAKIKLQRVGAKNQPYFRVVVQDESSSPSGSVIEILGIYQPLKEPTVFEVDIEKTKEWINKGAKPTEKVRILLGKVGILPPVNLAALPKKKPKSEKAAGGETATGEVKVAEKIEMTPSKEEPAST
ncbi:MAG: 30S ribosomal protein S16 [Candidatus Margulisiibacteriota bacterium]